LSVQGVVEGIEENFSDGYFTLDDFSTCFLLSMFTGDGEGTGDAMKAL